MHLFFYLFICLFNVVVADKVTPDASAYTFSFSQTQVCLALESLEFKEVGRGGGGG